MISDRSKLYERVSVMQRLSGRLAVVAAAATFFCVIAWMGGYDKSQKYLGGFNTNELLFNYHPVFMTLGMLFCGLSSMLTYRIINMPKLSFTKPLHGLLHTLAIVFLSVGLYAVFQGNNNKDKNEYNAYFANLYSIHSFVGLGAVLVYGCNYLLGVVAYVLGWVSDDSKRAYMPYHVFFGVFSLILIFIAVETGESPPHFKVSHELPLFVRESAQRSTALAAILGLCAFVRPLPPCLTIIRVWTGIMDLFRECGCDIFMDTPDYNPAARYHELPGGCRVRTLLPPFL